VREAVDALPDAQRRALMLSRFEGLAYEDIAQVMELSLSAVKSLLWRARDNVRRRLFPRLGDLTDD
jgi:RNA polymerase sigma-70 factor (ECF subfamily)